MWQLLVKRQLCPTTAWITEHRKGLGQKVATAISTKFYSFFLIIIFFSCVATTQLENQSTAVSIIVFVDLTKGYEFESLGSE